MKCSKYVFKSISLKKQTSYQKQKNLLNKNRKKNKNKILVEILISGKTKGKNISFVIASNIL